MQYDAQNGQQQRVMKACDRDDLGEETAPAAGELVTRDDDGGVHDGFGDLEKSKKL
uniref:Uncharacterized protein n=1 Tax=Peronospora matthiolae TaxID=2874970 RepID=A0AAV1TNC4_9STRA